MMRVRSILYVARSSLRTKKATALFLERIENSVS
jgi:hypothetical protein